MDIVTVITSVLSALGITSAGAWWLSRTWVEHRLARAKSEWDGEIKKNVDEYLAVRAAQITYEFEAKRRLYKAIGPHRFQLLLACRDLASRIQSYGLSGKRYSLNPAGSGYFGRDTLFRIVQPLALAELIERQMAYADFTIDRDAIGLLCFKKAAARALSGGTAILSHPSVNWDFAVEHLFKNSVRQVASALIVETAGQSDRVLRYDELSDMLKSKASAEKLGILINILQDFDIGTKPLFWLRLVCYGHTCAAFVNRYGQHLGFEQIDYDTEELVGQSQDEYTVENKSRFDGAFTEIANSKL